MSISGLRPETMSAMTRPLPAAMVDLQQPGGDEDAGDRATAPAAIECACRSGNARPVPAHLGQPTSEFG
jgi:hypothetical protein